jgi:hypothetical protein
MIWSKRRKKTITLAAVRYLPIPHHEAAEGEHPLGQRRQTASPCAGSSNNMLDKSSLAPTSIIGVRRTDPEGSSSSGV